MSSDRHPRTVSNPRRRALTAALACAAAALLLLPALAQAHVERASYWPDPAPDRSVTPAAGGKVPKIRSLYSALNKSKVGDTRVVCKPNSIAVLKASIGKAYERGGYRNRPLEKRHKLTKPAAAKLLAFNRRLAAHCEYSSIQDAVTDSHNNDRVVIMPGTYTEPKSRAAATNDPACADLVETNDRGDTGAVSYAYQLKCPNDQNLIAVMGRANGGEVPQPPLYDRHGIPNPGKCIRCNLQMEGSGVSDLDVIVDAGRVKSGNGAPTGAQKDVAIRADRADGFVLRNLTVRHAAEHGIYVLETDGYRLDRFRAFYNEEYGVLTFVEDHGVISNCEAAGSGDSGLYPGAAAETGEQTVEKKQRYNQKITHCDSHHNASGYSGTAANAVHITHNNFYDNALGFTTDVFTAAGHPGFPQDSDLIEHNNFFSNNFNPYTEDSDIEPTVPVPVGTGLWIAGGNNNTIRKNHFYDNWRRGTMLFSVPDEFVCGPDTGNSQAGCDPTTVSTSFRNQFHHNVMGVSPKGKVEPNGTDFWWDNFAGNTNNCWFANTGTDGTGKSITSVPPAPMLPSDCASSVGTGGPEQDAELLGCLASFEEGIEACPWFTTPPKPAKP